MTESVTLLLLAIVALIGAAYAYYWYSPAPPLPPLARQFDETQSEWAARIGRISPMSQQACRRSPPSLLSSTGRVWTERVCGYAPDMSSTAWLISMDL